MKGRLVEGNVQVQNPSSEIARLAAEVAKMSVGFGYVQEKIDKSMDNIERRFDKIDVKLDTQAQDYANLSTKVAVLEQQVNINRDDYNKRIAWLWTLSGSSLAGLVGIILRETLFK